MCFVMMDNAHQRGGKQIMMKKLQWADRMARTAIQWRRSVPLAFRAAGLMVPEPSFMLPTPFKAFVGWREGV